MKTVKSYNKIQTQNKIFGLEFFDLLVLLLAYLGIFLFSNNLLLNLALVGSAYGVLKIYKRGKAPHWSGSVLRFLMRAKSFSVKRERREELSPC
jgi:hypothetical protein